MKKILLTEFILMVIVSGCILVEEKNEIGEGNLIKKNASELVLTLEDVGDGWLFDQATTTENSSATAFNSKEQGLVVDYRYWLSNKVIVFPNISSAKNDFDKREENAKKYVRPTDIGIGNESYFGRYSIWGSIVFRYQNVVAYVELTDLDGRLDPSKKEELIRYAKILEQKIKKAAEEQ